MIKATIEISTWDQDGTQMGDKVEVQNIPNAKTCAEGGRIKIRVGEEWTIVSARELRGAIRAAMIGQDPEDEMPF